MEHSHGFAEAWRATAHGRLPADVLDLGSGGGIPGLVLARWWPATRFLLLDGSVRRTAWLTEAVRQLGLDRPGVPSRVRVLAARAEDAARGPERGRFDLVTARGFGPPAVTAECGAPFLRPGGRLLVAEPPEPGPGRWPVSGLAQLGLGLGPRLQSPAAIQVLTQQERTADRYPRRVGIPGKRPLWSDPGR